MSEEQYLKSKLVFPFLKLKLVSLPLAFVLVAVDDCSSLLYGRGMITRDCLKAGLMIRIPLLLGGLGTGRDGRSQFLAYKSACLILGKWLGPILC